MLNLKKYQLLLEYTTELSNKAKINAQTLETTGIFICGIKFKVQIDTVPGASLLLPTSKKIDIHVKDKNDIESINKILENFKIKYLKDYVIKPICEKYIPLINVPYLLKSINIVSKIKDKETILGSCKIYEDQDEFVLNFNVKLTEYLKPLVEYIVIHELCHAKLGAKDGMHTEKFWELLKRYSPQYKDFATFINAKSDFID